jgi:hypothetical protein
MLQEPLDRVEVAEMKLHQALCQAQSRDRLHRLLRKHREPSLEDHVFPPPQGLVQVLLNQPRCRRGIPGSEPMADGVVDQAVLLAPAGRPAMQLGHQVRLSLHHPGAEQVGEQVMQAPPAALLIKRHQEQVGPLQLLEHALAI